MKKVILMLIPFLFLNGILSAQKISGTIFNSKGESLEFVNIGVRGKNMGTVSDQNGNYQLLLDNADDADSVRISCIGYHPVNISVSELRTPPNRDFYLKQRFFELAEIRISPKEYKNKILGVTTSSKMIQGGFSDNMLGYECGVLMKIKKSAVLETVNFNISACSFDSVFYRLNIYRQLGKNDFENILKTPIYLQLPESSLNETIRIDLKPYHIYVEGNTLISLEHIKDLGEGQLLFCAGFGNKTYHRKTSQGSWETVPIGLSISVEAKVEK